MSDVILFFVKFPPDREDREAIYSSGPQRKDGIKYPPGPIGFVCERMARQFAGAISGQVLERTLDQAMERCAELSVPLYLRDEFGETCLVTESIPTGPAAAEVVRVEGEERRALIEMAKRITGNLGA